jgi:ATP-binding cassette, subfamily B, bacterial MsbA
MRTKKPPSLILLYKKYALPLWKGILVVLILSLITTVFTTIQPLLISGLLDVVMGNKDVLNAELESNNQSTISFFNLNTIGAKVNDFFQSNSDNEQTKVGVVMLTLKWFVFVAFMAAIFNYLSQVMSGWLRAQSSRLIRQDIAAHLMKLNLSFFHNQKSGEIVSRFTQDATNTAVGLGPLLNAFIHNSILIIFYSIYLFSTDLLLTMTTLLIILFQWGVTKILKNQVRTRERKFYDKFSNIVSTMQETLTNIRVIKSFGADKYELKKFDRDIDGAMNAEFNSKLIKEVEPNARGFLDNFVVACIFIVGFIQLQNDNLTLQGFVLFLLVGKLIITPINRIGTCFIWVQALLASYDRLHEIFETKNDVIDGKNYVESFDKNLIFKNVNFSYGDIEVLSNISFEIKKGEVIAIVGRSGSGKSTLTDLILRLYDPKGGLILLDDVDLKNLKGSQYRNIFGVVSQESLLFNDSIESNICFGRALNQKQIESVAKIANAHEFIINLPHGYNTVVGDRGVKLSGGQRQRISIARAIYASPEIVIFDEATSSLDSNSEKQVQLAINNVLSKSTAIIIAHRLSTILHADKIIVLNDGKIEAIGKHKELLDINSTYRELYNLQFNE